MPPGAPAACRWAAGTTPTTAPSQWTRSTAASPCRGSVRASSSRHRARRVDRMAAILGSGDGPTATRITPRRRPGRATARQLDPLVPLLRALGPGPARLAWARGNAAPSPPLLPPARGPRGHRAGPVRRGAGPARGRAAGRVHPALPELRAGHGAGLLVVRQRRGLAVRRAVGAHGLVRVP